MRKKRSRRRRPPKRGLIRKLKRGVVGLVFLSALLAVGSVIGLNLAVAFFGQTLVNPFSLRHIDSKRDALKLYASHRVRCLFTGHGDIEALVAQIAREHHLDEHLLAALVEVESGSRAHRISAAGAMGPAQLIPTTRLMLKVDDPFDPREGIEGGARYLKGMLKRFDGNERLALAGYNAGPGSVRGGLVPRNGETEYYVERVMASASRRRARADAR